LESEWRRDREFVKTDQWKSFALGALSTAFSPKRERAQLANSSAIATWAVSKTGIAKAERRREKREERRDEKG
jgi:hypothetical protein